MKPCIIYSFPCLLILKVAFIFYRNNLNCIITHDTDFVMNLRKKQKHDFKSFTHRPNLSFCKNHLSFNPVKSNRKWSITTKKLNKFRIILKTIFFVFQKLKTILVFKKIKVIKLTVKFNNNFLYVYNYISVVFFKCVLFWNQCNYKFIVHGK